MNHHANQLLVAGSASPPGESSRAPGRALVRALLLGGAAFSLMAVNDDNGCASSAETPEGRRAACQVASDCGGDPGVDCAGGWQCLAGECSFECGTTPTTDTSDTSDTDTRPEPASCYNDLDCPGAQICQWTDDCACPSGANCLIACPGVCVEPPAGKACTSTNDCGRGEYCTTEDGVCNSNCPPGMACPAVCWGTCESVPTTRLCYSDAECGFGEFCDTDPCVFPGDREFAQGDRIACGGVCAQIQQCQSDRDCATGEYCGCGPGLPNGLIPCYLQCLPRQNACQANADCGAGQICENGVCTPSRECQADSQCPRGWTCESACGFSDPAFAPEEPGGANRPAPCPNVCVPPAGPTCDDGTTCGPGERCEQICWSACPACDCAAGQDCFCAPCQEGCSTTCVPTGDPVTCSSDHECAAGHVCDFSNCNTYTDPDPSDPAGRPVMCLGECRPGGPPAYDCKQDSDCMSPSGRQGVCELEVCEYANFYVPCDPNGQSCDPRPPQRTCYGFCNYEQPAWCNPWDPNTCPDGFTCQSECDTGAANGLIYCPSRCVPDPTPTECVVTGCSGQVCAPEHVATTCEWRPWYICYRDALCGTQADGSCGWKETDAFVQCMRENGAYRR